MAALPPFQELLDAHAGRLHGYLRGLVGAQEADDCLQETLLAALRAYPQLRSAANLRAWLFTIAHRKALDHHRARGRRPVPAGELPEAPAPPAPDGEDPALWAAVAALPPKQRGAVLLRFRGDLAHEEIARVLGCSPEAARRSLHEGLRRLRKEMA
jgi:RNA polymerase sigma factor (sigma-70 family)